VLVQEGVQLGQLSSSRTSVVLTSLRLCRCLQVNSGGGGGKDS